MKTAGEMITKKFKDLICVSKKSSVSNAVKLMNEKNVGAILVKEDEKIIGIWTERDLLHNLLDQKFDIKNSTIEDFMTTDLITAESEKDLFQLMDIIVGAKIRHILVEKDGEVIGMLSSGDIITNLINEKDKEMRDLKDSVNWQYYENWKRR